MKRKKRSRGWDWRRLGLARSVHSRCHRSTSRRTEPWAALDEVVVASDGRAGAGRSARHAAEAPGNPARRQGFRRQDAPIGSVPFFRQWIGVDRTPDGHTEVGTRAGNGPEGAAHRVVLDVGAPSVESRDGRRRGPLVELGWHLSPRGGNQSDPPASMTRVRSW
jgi:hypothetical protein